MSKIDIISGFLGAGKTTLIQKLLKDCIKETYLMKSEVVLSENMTIPAVHIKFIIAIC